MINLIFFSCYSRTSLLVSIGAFLVGDAGVMEAKHDMDKDLSWIRCSGSGD